MKAILNNKYYNVGKENRYLVQTCSQNKDTGVKLSEVHGGRKRYRPRFKTRMDSEKISENRS